MAYTPKEQAERRLMEGDWGMLPYWRKQSELNTPSPVLPDEIEVQLFGRRYRVTLRSDGTITGELA